MVLTLLIQLAIALVLAVVAYALQPKPKKPKPPELQDLESPVAESGKPIPVVFGTMTVTGLNILWMGEKGTHQYEVNS